MEQKLVIAVSSSALFDLSESHQVFQSQGPLAYKAFQEANLDKVLERGVAFPFIRRVLDINARFPQEQPVEVVLLSRNSAATGRRVFRSIQHYGLGITRAAFTEGRPPWYYIPAFGASLFLSGNEEDVRQAIDAGYPAGMVMPGLVHDEAEEGLRVAFDFDGVIADDESESVYKAGALADFVAHEVAHSAEPHHPGPLADLIQKLSRLQKLEDQRRVQDPEYQPLLQTAIVTARSSPAHERVVTTLEHLGVRANQTFFLGGMSKERILKVLKPHIFFDDQKSHLQSEAGDIPMVHIPFGVANRT